MTILVTGGAGYIGSHTAHALMKKGFKVLILDNLIYGHKSFVEEVLNVKLIVGDIKDRELLDKLFSQYSIECVIHFAAHTYVRESVEEPAKYYQENVVGTLTLLEAMKHAQVNKIVFSSTCATYGSPEKIPIIETASQVPLSPYGMTKLICEKILLDFDMAYGIKSISFRYFNAAGAERTIALGEDRTPETHLIPLMFMTALGKREKLYIYGTDYDTPDGTCIRDYVHVSDLAVAHVLGLEYLLQGGNTNAFNLCNENGFSVRQIINAGQEIIGRSLPIFEEQRRAGDPPILVGDSTKVRNFLNWEPTRSDLKNILSDAWNWHQQRHL